MALVHQRFSTTPSRLVCASIPDDRANGEINTLRGNVNWNGGGQARWHSELYGQGHLQAVADSYEGKRHRVLRQGLEFLVQGATRCRHAYDDDSGAWAAIPLMDETRRAFYEYHAA